MYTAPTLLASSTGDRTWNLELGGPSYRAIELPRPVSISMEREFPLALQQFMYVMSKRERRNFLCQFSVVPLTRDLRIIVRWTRVPRCSILVSDVEKLGYSSS